MISQGLDPIRNRRIAHLIETDGPGGAERVVALLATRFQQAGARNVVFLPASGEGWLEEQLDGSGVQVEHFELERPLSPALARWLAGRFRHHRLDLAHSHEFTMAFYGASAAWAAKIPHVITMHGGDYYAGKIRRRLALRAAVAMSDRLVAVSEPLRTALSSALRLERTRVDLIPNGVPAPDRGTPTLRAELGLPPEARLAVAVGNLYPVKGHAHLVRALGLLAPRFPGLHVAIAGRGELREPLLTLAAAEGVADRLHLLGLRSDVSDVLSSADLFVLPSLSEGLPMALLEAMFAELPVVATSVGEIPEVLGAGAYGLLVPPEDAIALAAAMEGLLSHPARARRMGQRAGGRVARGYSVQRMAVRYTECYGRTLRPIAPGRIAQVRLDEEREWVPRQAPASPSRRDAC